MMQKLAKEVWRRLPIWFLYLEAIGLLHFMRANVKPEMFYEVGYPPYLFALTTIVPLAWVFAYYLLRIRRSQSVNKPLAYAGLVFLTVILPILIYVAYIWLPKYYLSKDQIRTLFEYSQFFWFALFIIHAYFVGGKSIFVTFWGVCLIYGIILENTGIILGYFSESEFKYYLWRLVAPICTMLGWVIVFYCATRIAEYFRELFPSWNPSVLKMALLTTAIALSFDFQLDPLASLSGIWWKWNDLYYSPQYIKYSFYLGVPIINFVAWFSAFLPFSYAYFWAYSQPGWDVKQRNWQLFLRLHIVVIVAGILNFGIMALIEGGFSGPTFQILNEFWDKFFPYKVLWINTG